MNQFLRPTPTDRLAGQPISNAQADALTRIVIDDQCGKQPSEADRKQALKFIEDLVGLSYESKNDRLDDLLSHYIPEIF